MDKKLLDELYTLLFHESPFEDNGLLSQCLRIMPPGGRWIGNIDTDTRRVARAKEIINILKGGEII